MIGWRRLPGTAATAGRMEVQESAAMRSRLQAEGGGGGGELPGVAARVQSEGAFVRSGSGGRQTQGDRWQLRAAMLSAVGGWD